jgi:signal transduction histidine kinase
MRRITKSIQWRLQMWHGALLLLILVAFGCTAYELARQMRFRLIDEEMEHATQQMLEAIAPAPDSAEFRAIFKNLLSSSLQSGALPDPASILNPLKLIETASIPEDTRFYVVFWKKDGTLLRHTKNAPSQLTPPLGAPDGISIRMVDLWREHVIVTKLGITATVGRSVAPDLADLHREAGLMAMAGILVASLGLAGGRWLAARAVKPIQDITATVDTITSGNLSRRIDSAETDSELGQLAAALNGTFDRLQSAFEQLSQALDRQTQFTADASHELRTPVAVVLAEINSTLTHPRSAEQYQESLRTCGRAARRMQRLTEGLLTLARMDAKDHRDERQPCNLDLVAREAIDLLAPLADQQDISLKSHLCEAMVCANSSQLAQVVGNLVSNAIIYNRPGGTVQVEVAVDGKHAQLAVTDDGPGIAEIDLPHIFERFYRADRARSSIGGHAGLGLAIAKAIVDSHGGSIRVVSQLGQMSQFIVRLPLHRPCPSLEPLPA